MPYSEFATLSTDILYLHLTTTGDIEITVGEPTYPETPEGCDNATLLDWTKTINLSDLKTGWYKFDISSVHTANKDFTLSLNNDLGEAKNLGFRLYKDCDSPMMGETVMTFPVGITSRTIPANLLSLVDGIDMLYVYLTIDAPLPCEGAILFDWNKGAYQEPNKTQWYEFDITPVLDQEKQVKLTFTNHSNENAWVIAELAFHCPYTKSIPIIVPVPANMSVDKWIDYSAFEASRIEHFYMGVTTREAAIELAATWEDARVTPSDGCLNATLVENEVLYEHAAGTHWYKFTADLFEGEGSFSRVHVINRSAKTVNITAGGTVGCEYNIATRTSFKLPRRFDLAFAIPVWVVEQMKKFIDDDVTEFYLELTTDQPIAFSFGMDACEEAIPFDWTTGHTQEALTTQWYNVDIAPVLANEQQIKLTFTNHSDQTAWVGTLVSLDCPFKVALPLAFPIPAGMSVDKVIDYSYFAATRLDQIYVGVTTDSKISVIAEAQSAIAHPNDKAACASAKTLKVDENNIHPAGTAWYKVDGSLFADMERLPKFRFETVSGETTTVTIGATVGCDYNIATRGTVKMPGGLDMYLRAPRFIFSVIEKFIDDDVNEFYVELTTDKDVEFTIFADHDEDLTACSSATDFVLSDSMTISLEADKDVWYKVDMKALKANDQDWSISVVNPSDKAVDVEVEVSPTCPMVASVMKEFTVPASINVATVITSEQIATYIAKFPNLVYYVRIRATENLTIEVTEPEVVDDVEACYEAIDYVYGTDIVLNGESDVWYKLNIKELREKNENIILSVTNNSNDTAKATLDIYDSCPVEYPIVSMKNLVVEPLQVIRREVSASYLPEDVDSIYLHVRATGSLTVNVATKEEPQPEHVFAYDTITQYYCPVDLPEITTWNDTVKVTELLDSVYTYNAESLVAPSALTQQEIANILGADFGLIAGTTPDMDASLALIKAFYVTNDSEQVADVVNVAWVTNAIPCGTTTHTMTLNVTDECSNIVSTEYVFDVVAQNVTTIEETITICSHELPYEWNDMQFATAGTHTTSIPNVYGCDSAKYILHLNVLPAIPATDVYATVCNGETFIWDVNNESYTESGKYSVTMASSDGCDSIVTLNLTVLPPAKRVVTDTTICNARYVWPINGKPYRTDAIDSVMLESVYGCDSVLHVLKLRVLPPTKTVKIDTVICASQLPFRWKDQVVWGNDHTVVEEYQFTTYDKFLGFECDSVEYLMNLYILPEAKEENKEVLLCVGDSYTWDVNGQSYTHDTAGTYQHTHVIKNSLGCDSIIHNLNLVVSDGFTLEARTICYGKTWDIEVDGITYSYNTSGTYLIESNSGCKATFVLKVLDAIPTTYVDSTVCFGETVTWEHETLNQTGSTTKTLKSVFGCDSVVIFNLTVLPQVADVEIYDTICFGEKYNWKETGKTYSTSTTDYVIKQDANGCDYKEILNLSVRPANNIVVEPVTKCYGETYTWYGDTYNASGQYFTTLQDINGCDSVAAIDLIILPQVLVTEENQLICEGDSIEWQGETIKEAGVYTKTLKNINGCDSVVNLNLAFLANGADTVINASICQGTSYDWYGEALTLAGTYTHYLSSCNATATLHLTINDPKYTSETIVACDSIEWNGTVYTASGTYIYRHTTTDGCEQVDTLHLTINKSEYETYTATACDEFTWHGTTYTQSGVYTFETTTSAGCKRVETLNLTINNSVTTEESVIACDSYPWNGTTYTQSGDYVAKLQTVNGCDSTVTLHLTINKSETVESTETACDSYEWHGVTYTQSGDYTYTTTTATGCIRVETLHLTINNPEYASYRATACDEYTWQLNGQTYDKSGVYTYESKTAAGCDKVDTLHLTINESYNLELTASACGSYEWNNQVYTASGDYVAQLQTVNGCDSIVTLHLIINPVQPDVLIETACGSYTWHGQVYTQSGTYTYSSTAVNGCEQVDTLHLTVYETEYKQEEKQYMCVGDSYTWGVNNETYYQGGIYHYSKKYSSYDCDSVVYTLNLSELAYGQDSIEYQTVCEPITWQGQYLSQSGIYRDTLANCNATLTLYLTVNHPVSSVITEEACKSYEWNNQVYTTSGDYTQTFVASNGCDSVVTLHLTIKQPVEVTKDVTACGSYTIDGKTYTQSGMYVQRLTAANGCDSIINWNLTINDTYKVELNETACDSYEWADSTYTTSGTYEKTFTAANGCDSVVTLHLTINKSESVAFTETACGSYKWSVTGVTYTESGVYADTTIVNGCDHIKTLYLTINKPSTADVFATACGSYTWNGTTYTTSGNYDFTTVAANGCDSVVTLHLTIHNPVTVEVSEVACGSYEWHGTTYTTSGNYRYTTTGVNGCDSITILHLTINQPVSVEYNATACDSYEWHGNVYTTSGDYTYTTKAANGCDSVEILHLTVNKSVRVDVYDKSCGAITWNGIDCDKTGDYTYTTTGSTGCDSTTILHLTVYETTEKTIIHSMCEGSSYVWPMNGNTYTTSGSDTYAIPFAGMNTCDSIVYTLNVVVLQDGESKHDTVSICEGLSYEFNGRYLTESGVYTMTLDSCNAVYTLTLNVIKPVMSDTIAESCGSFNWYGQEFTTPGDYTKTFKAITTGCDSIVTLHLTINPAETHEYSEVACESYDWRGTTYYTSGTYYNTVQGGATNGCDLKEVLHLTINDPKYTSETVVACDSIEWNGTVYTASGTYIYRHTTTDGCEQVDTLHLTINKSEYETYTATACDEFTWHGTTYTQSGVYTFETTTSAGCKRVETLNLTINNSVTTEESVIACDSYPWNGTTYTQSGDYVAKLQTVNGCDSTVTLHLTINKSETVESTETACDSYEWHGVTYTQSGDYTYTTTTATGCIRVETLHLTINNPEYASYRATACDEYTWQLNGQTYDKSGVYTYESKTAAGCDKVDTLHLTINESYNLELTASACGSYEWNNQVYTASGDYVAQLQTVNGCDSIVTLHLIINPVQPDVLIETACGSYTWHGQVYTQSGTYTYSSTAVNGCEQVDTLHLTVYETEYKQEEKQYMCVGDSYTWGVNNETYYQGGIYHYSKKYSSYDCDSVVYTLNLSELAYGQDSIEYQTVCEPITWQGQYLSQSGIYRDTLANCNATLTLYLTVNHPVSSVITEEACKSYEWNNQVYTTSGDYTQTFVASNGCDSVVTLHLTIKQPVEVTKDVTACGSYTIDGKTYTQSGMYVQRLTAANGCDSIINWNLTINDTYKVELNETACDSYEWADSTYTTSGTYEKTFTAANGCDSVVTLHLTINKSESVAFTETACGSYKWSVTGVTYTESGVYADTTIVNGCDHIKTLYLTINKPSTADVFATACGSYTWNGTTYTTSGNYDFTTVAANGCDSVVTLHLTIHNPVTVEVSEVACGSYEWHGTTYTTSGNYRYTTTGVNGCDSITILHLTINQPVSVEYNATACDSYEWHGNVYTTSGDYTYTTKAANGCDSVEILHLTVNKSVRVDVYDKSCGAITWNGIDCDKTGDYTYTTTGSTGCDSTTILHLTVYETTEKTIIHSMCEGSSYVWPMNGNTYTTSGSDTYAIPFAGMNTCDSIVYTLNVVVLQDGESKHDTVSICEGLSYEFNGRYLTESGVYTMTLDSCNAVYTLTLNVIKPVMSDTIAESCGSFNWYGQEFTTPGDYTKTFKAITTGCDSIVTLHLTINPAETHEYSEVACESYDWRGTTYYTSGTYYNTVQGGATNGCDLKEVLHLTVHPKTDDVVDNVTICSGESYVWNNKTYTTSTTETVTLQDANGCDYQAILNLTVLPATQYEPVETATICYGDNYLWHDTTYTTQGTHQYVLKNVANCDSIVYTLDLKVRPRVSPTTTTKAICDGDEFVCPISGISYNTSGHHSHTLQDVNGCDSLVTVHLIVMEKVDTVLYDTICHGDTYTFHGKVCTTSGVYENTLPSVLTPCDSVVTLHLHVLPEIPAIIDKETIDEGQVYIWPVNNQPYSVAGTYKETLTAANGCDSVRILELTVIPAPVYQVERDTISEYICDGTGYVDPITEKQHIISSLIPSTQTWNDTVNVTATLDSIYTFIITPIVAPEVMTDAVLEAIGATPTLTQGALPNVTGTVDAITAYYNGNDSESIADVNNVYWSNANTAVECGADTHTMTLVVEAGCDNVITTTHVFNVQPIAAGPMYSMTICAGDSYLWPVNGKSYAQGGIYVDTIKTISGCDSIVTLELTVLPEAIVAPSNDVIIFAGKTYTWPVNNMTYSKPGIYKDTLKNYLGCDSLINTLNLTVMPVVINAPTTYATICYGDTYVWEFNGKPYDAAGLYSDTIKNSYGSDSIVAILSLNVLPDVIYAPVEEATICFGDTYNWRGQERSESASDTLKNYLGCDSIIYRLNLTINKPAYTEIYETTCDSYDWYTGKLTESGVYVHTLQTTAGCDSIVTLRLTINKSDTVEFTEVACDSYTWHGEKYESTGDYTYRTTNASGCEQLEILHLTINKSFYKEETVTACDSYTWSVDGNTYAESGDKYFNGKTVTGCDSTYVLHLTINKSFYKEETVTACDSYTWSVDGNTYSESGDKYFNGKTVAGCDSTYVLHLTINKSFYKEETVTACDSYTWSVDGNTYSESGDKYFNGKTVAGCDSTYVLHLTINKSFYNEETVTACDSYTWSVDGNTYTESGDKYYNGQTVAGCDSTYVLHLTINKSFYKEETVTACDSYTWSVDGNTYTESGDKYYNGQTVAGCDSTYVLHLTINKSVLVEESVTACVSYTWNGQTYTISGDYTFQGETAAGCDSVAILHLTILPDVVYEPAETDYLCLGSTYEWFGNVFNAPGTYTHTLHNSLGCDSIIYTLELVQYVNTLPVITADDIVAVCGSAIEVTIADAIINAHIASEALYAPNAEIKWYMLNGDTYVELTNTAIDGSLTELTLKVVVTTDCGSVESDPIVVQVKTPSPENDDTLDEVPAYNKYGGRLLTVDLKYINDTLGLDVAEDEVTWYLVVEGADDIEQGKGYYLTTEDGTPLPAGEYYALISYQGKTGGECDLILQTIILIVETQVGPLLAPTVANPNELLRLLHLDANTTSTISIYSSTGQMLDTFQVKDAKEISFEAAHTAGYYIVEVQTESDKVSLRYVVK